MNNENKNERIAASHESILVVSWMKAKKKMNEKQVIKTTAITKRDESSLCYQCHAACFVNHWMSKGFRLAIAKDEAHNLNAGAFDFYKSIEFRQRAATAPLLLGAYFVEFNVILYEHLTAWFELVKMPVKQDQ